MDINVRYYQRGGGKRMMNKKMITLIGVAALMASIVTMNTQSASASTTSSEGSSDGKAEGHSDAINGNYANDDCNRDDNEYCFAYRVAYNAEYYWTKIVQNK